MGRKRIGAVPLTNAQKQERHRERQKAKLEALEAELETLKVTPALDISTVRESMKQELIKSWAPEFKATRIAEQRKEGRRLARKADQSHAQGRIEGICNAAAFFIGRDRVDISRALLDHFMIDRETAEAALEADKRTKSLTLTSLDKAGAWEKPPPVIR